MQPLLQSGVSNLILAQDGQNQAAVAFEAAFQEAVNGSIIVALVDNKSEGDVLGDRFKLWLRARDHDPALFKRMMFVTDWRRLSSGVALHAALVNALGAEHRNATIVILADLSGDMLATTPDHPWLKVATDTVALLPFDSMAVTVIATGPAGMPVPTPDKFPAERIYTVQSSGTAMHITVTPAVPAGTAIKLHGKIAPGGIVIVDDDGENHG